MKPGGVLYTCFKYGESDYDDERGRHFTCATERSVDKLLDAAWDDIEINGMKVWTIGDTLGGRDLRWVNVLAARKRIY